MVLVYFWISWWQLDECTFNHLLVQDCLLPFRNLISLSVCPWFCIMMSTTFLQMILIYFWISWWQLYDQGIKHLFIQIFFPPFRKSLSCAKFLGILILILWINICFISFKYCTHFISDIIITIIIHLLTISWFLILHYSVRDVVTDGSEIFFNFLVIVLGLGFWYLGILLYTPWDSYLYSLDKNCIVSFKYWMHSISNIILTIITYLSKNNLSVILHYNVQEVVTDDPDIFLNFLVTVVWSGY